MHLRGPAREGCPVNRLALRHLAFRLLAEVAAKPNGDLATVEMSNPVDPAGPWSVVVTTSDRRTFRLTVTEE